MKTKGTPKTIAAAVSNGICNSTVVLMGTDEADGLATDVVPHLRDFLAQRFSVVRLNANDDQDKALRDLWKSIFGETLK